MASTKELLVKLTLENKKLLNGMKQAQGSTNSLKSGVGKLKLAYAAVAGVMAGVVVKGLTAVIKRASDAQETFSKFDTVFKDVRKEADKVAKNFSKNFGLSSTAAKQLLSDTGDLLSGFGFTGKAALDLSKEVNELAVDLASFTNFSGGAEGASQALTKALLGERESAKALGIAILETDVQAKVLELTQRGLTFETERQAKAYATLEIAQQQSKNAIGDFARTSEGFANQVRILRARFDDLIVALGSKLLPVVLPIVSKFADLLTTGDNLSESTGTLVSAYEEWQKVAKKTKEQVGELSDKQKALNLQQVANAKLKFFENIKAINEGYEDQVEEITDLQEKSKKYSEAVKESEKAIRDAKKAGEDSAKVNVEIGLIIKELGRRNLNLAKAESFVASTRVEGLTAGEEAKSLNADLQKSITDLAVAENTLGASNVSALLVSKELRGAVIARAKAMRDGTFVVRDDTAATVANTQAKGENLKVQEIELQNKIALLEFEGNEFQVKLAELKLKENELIQKFEDEKTRITKAAKEQRIAIVLDEIAKQTSAYAQYTTDFLGLATEFSDARLKKMQNLHSKELTDLEKRFSDGVISEAEYNTERERLEKEHAHEEARIARKSAIVEKVQSIFKIWANAGVAVMKAVAASPFTGGLPWSALIPILAGGQTAAVLANPLPEVPAFQQGGIISGLPGGMGGEDGIIAAQNGEAVLNRQATAVLGSDAITALNEGRQVANNINITVQDGRGAVDILDEYFRTQGTSARGLAI